MRKNNRVGQKLNFITGKRLKNMLFLIIFSFLVIVVFIFFNNCNTGNDGIIGKKKPAEKLNDIALVDYGNAIGFRNDLAANELQQILNNKVEELDVPGIQASVRTGGFYWHSAGGSIDLKKEEKLTIDHILRIGSVTKIFTAAIILKLYEQGKISLDDKIDKWFPKYPKAGLITIRQLLNHRSGIFNYTENLSLGIQSVLLPKKRWDPAVLLKSTYNKKFYFLPGAGHHYSNTNYLILGLIIEEIIGEPLSKVYREYIFEPYNLNNTFFIPYEKTPEYLITGYDRDVIPLGVQKVTPGETSFATLGFSAGAVVSTAKDLCNWIDSLFKSGFLKDETLDEMTNYLQAKDDDVPKQTGYGLGLRILNIDDDILFGHTGTIPGFGAAVFYCPEKDYSIAIISNVSMFDQISVLEGFISTINNKCYF
jgi:D-alanyl-D-alanine carboxypeptidase